ncbi:heavy metal-associated isoprenylated plant protein 39-like [Salvia splendens]|uniref:heavy metal-associated isoprenylated plant protein 39-like n=1 Tax=Salvia splendens TaxID=180675 RepID=UPI001C2552F1|nr:heavy metal-associated isoprenylated plant protein 39-like [Salvia splendens]
MTKKMVLKLGVHDGKEKRKALRSVSSLSGIESLSMDMKEKKLTVVEAVDPIEIVGKLKQHCRVKLVTTRSWKIKHNPYYTHTSHVYSAEENPNACVIS